MKKLAIGLLLGLFFVGCSSMTQNSSSKSTSQSSTVEKENPVFFD